MRTKLVVGLAVGALGLVAAACSSSPSTPAPPDSTVAEFCGDWATAVCQLSSFCQFDPAGCSTYQTSVCTQFAGTAQASGTRQYSQPAGKACVDALTKAYGGSPSMISADALVTLDDTCNKAFTGNVASDSKCTSTYDCSSGLTCSPIPGMGASVCAAGSSKDAGDICTAGDMCQGDTYCAPVSGLEPKCTPTPTTGGACSDSIPCGSADSCNGGVCTPKVGVGKSCATSADCSAAAPYCDTYPPAACVTGLTFARGSIDCNGIAGLDQPGADASVADTGTVTADTGTAADTGSAVDSGTAATDSPSGG